MDSFTPLTNHWFPSRCLHCCPQRNDFSPLYVHGQQSLDLRSWPSCVEQFVYLEVVSSTHCKFVQSWLHLDSIKSITLFMPEYFVLRMGKFLSQHVGEAEM